MKHLWPMAAWASLLLLSLSIPRFVSASGPAGSAKQQSGEVIGIASNPLSCLAIGIGASAPTVGVVKLNWQGQAESARLMVTVSGAEAEHTIKVNGQPVAKVPIHPGGQLCGADEDSQVFYLDFPPEVLVQGNNRIELTNDVLAGDSWSAAYVRLVVSGRLAFDLPDSSGQVGPADITAFSTVFTASFINSYDGTSQEFMGQIPTNYNPATPTPLLVAVHGRSGGMDFGVNAFGTVADNKGWLLASPELHGNWPPPPTSPQPPNPGAFAYASVQAQYDVVGTVKHMIELGYNVDSNRIYLYGSSMGAQTGIVTVAKFPHLFAAIFANKGPTDMAEWYDEQDNYYTTFFANPDHLNIVWMRRECHINGQLKDPSQNPFCYQRRSGLNFASNYIHVPISLTHSISDALVPIHHSRDLRDVINNYGPDQIASLYEDTYAPTNCPGPAYHCFEPDYNAVLTFLQQHTLNNNPTNINIVSDQSKTFYWLKLTQTGGDHFSRVQASYNLANKTMTATISDTNPLTVAFNLGPTPITDIIPQPGMGLPATTYLVKGGGNNTLKSYTSGYLNVNLSATGQFNLTISAISTQVSANPIAILADGVATSTLTVTVKDQLNQPVSNGTVVQFSTTSGTFPNGATADTATVSGGAGQAKIVLRSGTTPGVAQVVATVGTVTGTTSVYIGTGAPPTSIYVPVVIKNN